MSSSEGTRPASNRDFPVSPSEWSGQDGFWYRTYPTGAHLTVARDQETFRLTCDAHGHFLTSGGHPTAEAARAAADRAAEMAAAAAR